MSGLFGHLGSGGGVNSSGSAGEIQLSDGAGGFTSDSDIYVSSNILQLSGNKKLQIITSNAEAASYEVSSTTGVRGLTFILNPSSPATDVDFGIGIYAFGNVTRINNNNRGLLSVKSENINSNLPLLVVGSGSTGDSAIHRLHVRADGMVGINTNSPLSNLHVNGNCRIESQFEHRGTTVGLYGATPVTKHSSTGQTAGFTAGTGTPVNNDSTFTGGTGSTAYTIGDIVKALKNIGIMSL